MIFTRYGLQLKKIQEEDLETIRQWRNQDFVRSRMHFTELVNKEQQQKWFANLDPLTNWYFIASASGNQLGVFNIKNIDWHTEIGEAGAFVSDTCWIGEMDTAFAILSLMDFAFFMLGLVQLQARWNPGFPGIDKLNRGLGYEPFEKDDDGFVCGSNTVNNYLEKTRLLRNAAIKKRGGATAITGHNYWLQQRLNTLRIQNRIVLV